jgi:hypothetical protein
MMMTMTSFHPEIHFVANVSTIIASALNEYGSQLPNGVAQKVYDAIGQGIESYVNQEVQLLRTQIAQLQAQIDDLASRVP